MKIIIIGNGIAGNQVAFTLTQENTPNDIYIVSAEDVPEYDPCSLPYFLGGDVEKNAVFRKKIRDYARSNIKLIFNSRIISIDPDQKTIKTDKNIEMDYDKLVLAHGGSLFIPPIRGIKNKGVFSCKQLLETEKLNLHKGKSAVVIGSGAIGIEAAEALKKKGYEVHIIELFDWILPTLFDEPTAKRLENSLKSYGISVCTKEKVLEIKGETHVTGVVTDRRELECDTVVVATGVVAGTQLAETAGIETGRGIRVNEYMETSVSDIYACGDCVETFDACTGEPVMFQLKHNAIEQGKIVAKNIAGKKIKYSGAHAFARAHFFNTHAASFGSTMRGINTDSSDTRIIEREDGENYLRVILKNGKIAGGQAIGKYAEITGLLIGAMRRKDDIDLLRAKWDSIVRSKSPCLLPQLRLGHIFGFTGPKNQAA